MMWFANLLTPDNDPYVDQCNIAYPVNIIADKKYIVLQKVFLGCKLCFFSDVKPDRKRHQ